MKSTPLVPSAAASETPSGRSFADIFKDMLQHGQTILRLEVRLAQSQLKDQLSHYKAAAILIGLAIIGGLFGFCFALLALFFVLSDYLPTWAAALCTAVPLFILAAALLIAGLSRLKQHGVDHLQADSGGHPPAQE